MGQIETKLVPPVAVKTPHQEVASPLPKSSCPETVTPAPPEPTDRISVEEAVRRWLDGQDDARLPSFEDLQIDIGTLKLRPEEKQLLKAVDAMRKLTENSG